jgi:signal transduction histidine kinase
MDTILDSQIYKRIKFEQILGLVSIGIGFALFILSAYSYASEPFFLILLTLRWICFIVPFFLVALIALSIIKSKNVDTFFYLFALLCQSIMAVLEGKTSLDFYFYSGVFFILTSLSFRGTFNGFLRYILPISSFLLLGPMISKSPEYFATVSILVDKFSAQIVAFVIGFIITRSNTKRFEILEENFRLKLKIKEAEMKSFENEIQKATLIEEELIKAKKKIESDSKIYAIGLVASQISHDLRSPLSALSLVLSTLEGLSVEQKNILNSSINRINQIVKSILKSENSNPQLNNTFRRQLEDLRSEKLVGLKKGIDFQCSVVGCEFRINDLVECELMRVMSNLLNNSFEAIEKAGQVLLSVSENNKQLLIEVKDNGRGIPKPILSRVGSEVLTYGKEGIESGNGLGLSYSSSVIRDLGGSLDISSVEGIGTKISITIPISNLILNIRSKDIAMKSELIIHPSVF